VGPHRVQPALITWWTQVLDHFAWHEGRHIRIQQSYDRKLRTALLGHACSSARTIIRRWGHRVDAAQHRFDVSDYSWQPEWSVPYAGPQG
jgi:predicted secreted Zn-dependent protease